MISLGLITVILEVGVNISMAVVNQSRFKGIYALWLLVVFWAAELMCWRVAWQLHKIFNPRSIGTLDVGFNRDLERGRLILRRYTKGLMIFSVVVASATYFWVQAGTDQLKSNAQFCSKWSQSQYLDGIIFSVLQMASLLVVLYWGWMPAAVVQKARAASFDSYSTCPAESSVEPLTEKSSGALTSEKDKSGSSYFERVIYESGINSPSGRHVANARDLRNSMPIL
jgi:hypothetical protein